jgi:hypothetical protein
MKTTLICLALLFVGCADETETTDLALGQSILGTWTIKTSVHDGIPCTGKLELAQTASGIAGGFYCLDTAHTPDSNPRPNTAPNEYWVLYGTGTATGTTPTFTVVLRGGSDPVVTDSVVLSGNQMTGSVLNGTR